MNDKQRILDMLKANEFKQAGIDLEDADEMPHLPHTGNNVFVEMEDTLHIRGEGHSGCYTELLFNEDGKLTDWNNWQG